MMTTSQTAGPPQERFRIRGRIGAGGMADVFLAEQVGMSGFGKLVALKRLHHHLSEDPRFVKALVREARLSACLNHPNIVQTLDLGSDGRGYYIAMEYVEGTTLALLLRLCRQQNVPLPVACTLEILREVCRGLAYAHEATDLQGVPLRIVHRDLKPANILVSRHGAVKISDFGVARADHDWQRTLSVRALKGTIGYMSPEQARCEEIDHRSDLFSLGALLFEMLTLQPLYAMQKSVKRLFLVQDGKVEDRLTLLQPFPPALVRLTTWLLARDPRERPMSAAEVLGELNTIRAPESASPVAVGELVRRLEQADRESTDLAPGTETPTPAAIQELLSAASGGESLPDELPTVSVPRAFPRPAASDQEDVPTIMQDKWTDLLAWSGASTHQTSELNTLATGSVSLPGTWETSDSLVLEPPDTASIHAADLRGTISLLTPPQSGGGPGHPAPPPAVSPRSPGERGQTPLLTVARQKVRHQGALRQSLNRWRIAALLLAALVGSFAVVWFLLP